ncbi:hypothetical protein ACEPAH_7799 [Sanghuangporus vaninii]
MALPSLKDLLPDHLFYDVPPSTANYFVPPPPPPPPPPTSATFLPSQPLYSQGNSVSFSSHQTQQERFPAHSTQPVYDQTSASDPSHSDRRDPDIGGSLALSDLDRTRFIFDGPSLQVSDNGQNDPIDPYWSDDENNDALDHSREEPSGSNDRVKKHSCKTCGKGFNRPSSLRIHANTHTGAKPFVCPFPLCGRTFNVSSNMRRHYRNHSTRAPAPLPPLQFNGTDRIHLPANSWTAEPQPSQAFVQGGHRVSTGIPPLPHVSATPQAVDIYRTGPYMERFGSAMLGAEAAARAAWRAESSARGQLVHTVGPHVQYEYPCPPLSIGSASTEALYPATPAFHYTVHQLRLDGPNPAGAEVAHEDYGTYSLQDHHLPNAFPPSLPPVPTPGRHSTPPYPQGGQFDAPLTPPHTNEASLSPPLRTRSRAPLLGDERSTSKQDHLTTHIEESGHDWGHSAHLPPRPDSVGGSHSSSDYVPISRHTDLLLGAISEASADEDRKRRRDEAKGVVMEQKTEVRQQPSPDTPSFHVSELRSDGLRSRFSEKADNTAVSQNEARKDVGAGEELEIIRRSSLTLKDILRDDQEPHSGESIALSTESHQTPPNASTLSASPSGSVLPREMPNSAPAVQSQSQDSESRSKKRAVGTTPGAAPPPPYPLYSLPPADVADNADRATRKTAGKVESARPKKKRRRR